MEGYQAPSRVLIKGRLFKNVLHQVSYQSSDPCFVKFVVREWCPKCLISCFFICLPVARHTKTVKHNVKRHKIYPQICDLCRYATYMGKGWCNWCGQICSRKNRGWQRANYYITLSRALYTIVSFGPLNKGSHVMLYSSFKSPIVALH
jgi:hypothetical protein